tara:strand:- start:1333 stop:1590 length:258 start_codon:yes stop_codon:yes gene_type:complete
MTEYKVSKQINAELPQGGKGSLPKVKVDLLSLGVKDKLTIHMPEDQAKDYVNAVRQKVYRYKLSHPNTSFIVHLIEEGIGVWRTQ